MEPGAMGRVRRITGHLLASRVHSGRLDLSAQSAAADVSGKVCLVTGASSGIGADAARTFAKAGVKVVLTARREDELRKVVDTIRSEGGDAAYVLVDVTDDKQVQAAFDFAQQRYGGVDFVFANAGYNGNAPMPLTRKPESEIKDVVLINTVGALFTLRHAVSSFKKRGGGAIVFTSSILAHQNYKSSEAMAKMGLGGGGSIAYQAAKAGVDMVSRAAGQYSPVGVRSYSLQVSYTDTEMLRSTARQASKALGAEIPASTFGSNNIFFDTPADATHVGRVALALFDESSAWRPGQVIIVDNDATADASAWTAAYDRPLDTPSGLPSREEARKLMRDVKGRPYH